MPSLREIKDRIGSVKSTLKITGAMKLVASSKLRKAQKAIEALRPYEKTLSAILSAAVSKDTLVSMPATGTTSDDMPQSDQKDIAGKTAVVVVTSNSSLCGAFNANAARKALETLSGLSDADVYAVGRKGADALRKAGYPSEGDWSDLSGKPTFARAGELAGMLSEQFNDGKYDRVLLVYNHFVSTSRQEVVVETYLPFNIADAISESSFPSTAPDYIIEPDPQEVISELVPKVLNLKIYASVLDSSAAEHAARTVAMQTASDNAEDILSELTLEYNKGRQQKITSELLDILGGKVQ